MQVSMISTALLTTLFIIVLHACASHANENAPPTSSMTKDLFRALQAGVLKDAQRFLYYGCLSCYELLPTEDWIRRYEELLFKQMLTLKCCRSNRAASDSMSTSATATESTMAESKNAPSDGTVIYLQCDLAAVMRKQVANERGLQKLLVNYAIFRIFLFGSLGEKAHQLLKTVFSGQPDHGPHRTERLVEFIDELGRVEGHSNIFAILVKYYDRIVIAQVLTHLNADNPDVATELVKAYAEGDTSKFVKIPKKLFSELTSESQYYLRKTITGAYQYDLPDPWEKWDIVELLFKFPRLSRTKKPQTTPLVKDREYLAHEEPQAAVNDSPVESSKSTHDPLPDDIWRYMLRFLDYRSFLRMMLQVRKAWWWSLKEVLDHPSIQELFARCMGYDPNTDPDPSLRVYSWSRLVHGGKRETKDAPSNEIDSFVLDALTEDSRRLVLDYLDILHLIHVLQWRHEDLRPLLEKIMDLPLIQETFSAYVASSIAVERIFGRACYPWSKLHLYSPQAFFEYFIACRENGRKLGLKGRDGPVWRVWDCYTRELMNGTSSVPPESYLEWYLRSCRLIVFPHILRFLEFPQPPGMSGTEYAESVRELITTHKIVVDISKISLGESCGRFAEAMAHDPDLIDSLFEDKKDRHDWLAIYLLLEGTPIPLAVDKKLRGTSKLYRLWTSEYCSTEDRLVAVLLAASVRRINSNILARATIRFCLAEASAYDPESLQSLGKRVWTRFISQPPESVRDHYRWDSVAPRELGKAVLGYLCKHHQHYSEDQFDIIERVLEELRIFGADGKPELARRVFSDLVCGSL